MRFLRGEVNTRREGSRHRSATRIIGYTVVWNPEGVSEYAVRDLLRACCAVTGFGTDSGFVWFTGWPGEPLRTLRDRVVAFTGGRSISSAERWEGL